MPGDERLPGSEGAAECQSGAKTCQSEVRQKTCVSEDTQGPHGGRRNVSVVSVGILVCNMRGFSVPNAPKAASLDKKMMVKTLTTGIS